MFAVCWLTGTKCTGSPMLNQFIHANIFHLLLNLWATWTIVRSDVMPAWSLVLVGMFIGWVGFLCAGSVVGFSAVLYAMLGMQWRLFGNKTNAMVTASVFLLGAVLPGLTFIAHALPFFLGIAYGWVYNMINNYNHET